MPDKNPVQHMSLVSGLLLLASLIGEAGRAIRRQHRMSVICAIVTFLVNVAASFVLGVIAILFMLDTGASEYLVGGIGGLFGYLGAATTEQFMRHLISRKFD